MPEYTYLLETRLSSAQLNALTEVRDAVRQAGMTIFLAGGAVRDLTTGSSVRDLDFAVQGNALELRSALEARGGTFWGEHVPSRTLFFWFPGSVTVEVASTRSESFPKPGEAVYEWSGIVDDLHRRDFTANAMALSLNEGSYGLLLDPMNGVADIEARQLRLVSNYGFIEDPSRLLRLVRLRERLGWTVEERTAQRYENAKEADGFDVVPPFRRGYELEEIAAEENALPVLRALQAEGWMLKLFPEWTPEAADAPALDELHRNRIQLLMQGIAPDLTAAHLQLLTTGMDEETRVRLKASLVRPGLRAQWEGLEEAAKEFARLLTGKEAGTPSATWKMFHTHPAEPILWLARGRKTPAAEAKFKNLFTVWPEVAKKVPVALMLELRIVPELPEYPALLHELFLQQIDGKLESEEAMRAFLEPYSPPAPPPPVTLRRSRGKKAEGKGKRKGAARDDEDDDAELDEDEKSVRPDEDAEESEDEDEGTAGPPELNVGRSLANVDLGRVLGRIAEDEDSDELVTNAKSDAEDDDAEDDEEIPPPAPTAKKGVANLATSLKDEEIAPAQGSQESAAPLVPTPTKTTVKSASAGKAVPSPQPEALPPAKKATPKPAEPPVKKQSGVPKTSPPAKTATKKAAEPAKAAKEEPQATPAKKTPVPPAKSENTPAKAATKPSAKKAPAKKR